MPRWIVDASNVMGSRPDGWWRDRDRALGQLVDEVARWRAVAGQPVLVVADGSPSARVPEGTVHGVHVRYAHSRARDAADHEIAGIVARHHDPSSLVVATADRDLRGRVERHGATVVGPRQFLETVADIPERRYERAVLARFGTDESALLGRGGEARVYAVDDERVVRLPAPGTDPASLDERRRLLDHVRRTLLPFDVPEVLEHVAVEGRVVVVERRLPGRDALEVLGERSTDRAALVRSHLDAAQALATVEAPIADFGEIWGPDAIRSRSFAEWAAGRLQDSLAAAGEGFAELDPVALTAELVSALRDPAPATPRLVHLDAFLGNMLADDDRITAVLDFGPMAIAGPPDLDAAVAVAYLAPEITPTVREEDGAVAQDWVVEHGLTELVGPAERWMAAYWSAAVGDDRLHRWCRRVVGSG